MTGQTPGSDVAVAPDVVASGGITDSTGVEDAEMAGN